MKTSSFSLLALTLLCTPLLPLPLLATSSVQHPESGSRALQAYHAYQMLPESVRDYLRARYERMRLVTDEGESPAVAQHRNILKAIKGYESLPAPFPRLFAAEESYFQQQLAAMLEDPSRDNFLSSTAGLLAFWDSILAQQPVAIQKGMQASNYLALLGQLLVAEEFTRDYLTRSELAANQNLQQQQEQLGSKFRELLYSSSASAEALCARYDMTREEMLAEITKIHHRFLEHARKLNAKYLEEQNRRIEIPTP